MATNATQIGPLSDLTGFQRDILTVIAHEGTPYGLEVKRELERVYSVQDINHGRLYPNIDTLVEKGLVDKSARDKRTNEYEVTTRGRNALSADVSWRDEATEE